MKLLSLSERLAVAREADLRAAQAEDADWFQHMLAMLWLEKQLEEFLRPAQGGQLLQLAHSDSRGGAE